MDYFDSLKDSDIFDTPLPEPVIYTDRPTVKGIVLDKEGKIALLYGNGYGLFPGGGIEEDETPEGAFLRECKEEIGCDVEIVKSLGVASQLRARDARRYVIHFFVATVLGEKGEPTTTQEDELACSIKWLSEDEIEREFNALLTFLPQDAYYQTNFNARTHFAAFQKYLRK